MAFYGVDLSCKYFEAISQNINCRGFVVAHPVLAITGFFFGKKYVFGTKEIGHFDADMPDRTNLVAVNELYLFRNKS